MWDPPIGVLSSISYLLDVINMITSQVIVNTITTDTSYPLPQVTPCQDYRANVTASSLGHQGESMVIERRPPGSEFTKIHVWCTCVPWYCITWNVCMSLIFMYCTCNFIVRVRPQKLNSQKFRHIQNFGTHIIYCHLHVVWWRHSGTAILSFSYCSHTPDRCLFFAIYSQFFSQSWWSSWSKWGLVKRH